VLEVNALVSVVFSGLSALVVEGVTDQGDLVRVVARTRDDPVPCPVCGTPTGRVHGFHGRTVTDVPVDGRRVVVSVRVRRFVCPVLGASGRRSVSRCPACWGATSTDATAHPSPTKRTQDAACLPHPEQNHARPARIKRSSSVELRPLRPAFGLRVRRRAEAVQVTTVCVLRGSPPCRITDTEADSLKAPPGM
jgi:hypothetical protein